VPNSVPNRVASVAMNSAAPHQAGGHHEAPPLDADGRLISCLLPASTECPGAPHGQERAVPRKDVRRDQNGPLSSIAKTTTAHHQRHHDRPRASGTASRAPRSRFRRRARLVSGVSWALVEHHLSPALEACARPPPRSAGSHNRIGDSSPAGNHPRSCTAGGGEGIRPLERRAAERITRVPARPLTE